MKRRLSFTLVVGFLLVCGPLFAHHGASAYDVKKIVVLKGATVTRFVWANPHNLVLFDMKDNDGNVVHWSAELSPPSVVTARGWNRNSLQPGDVVTVYLIQSKLGTPVGRITKIELGDGKTLTGGGESALQDPDYSK